MVDMVGKQSHGEVHCERVGGRWMSLGDAQKNYKGDLCNSGSEENKCPYRGPCREAHMKQNFGSGEDACLNALDADRPS